MSKDTPGIPYEPNDGAPAKGYRLDVMPRLDSQDFIDPDETKLAATKLPAMAMMNTRAPILDQLPLGACTANGWAHIFATMLLNAGKDAVAVSRLQLYYDERKIEGDIPDDSGADPRDGAKVMQKQGVGREDLWPYDIAKFTQQPPAAVYQDAPNHKVKAYYRVVSLHNLKSKIAANIPVGLAMLVYEQMERSTNGVIAMPSGPVLGGHWLTITGYCDRSQNDWPGGGYIRLDNSWGAKAGDGTGCYYLPYAYLLNSQLCPAMWRIVLP